ncbi:MAG: nucleoside deaminase [Deltaproteobacteria bacterium]|nr:nucleoside deaminase [Deltaproteobacteria bacterium]
MEQAIALARQAEQIDEVPIGAVIVQNDRVIGTGFNVRESLRCITRHAEIIALEDACKQLKNWRLPDCDIYVTLEPCIMCAGALVQARIRTVYFGAYDPKAGALGSLYKLHEDKRLNHRLEVVGGVLSQECGNMLSTFFHKKRVSK